MIYTMRRLEKSATRLADDVLEQAVQFVFAGEVHLEPAALALADDPDPGAEGMAKPVFGCLGVGVDFW